MSAVDYTTYEGQLTDLDLDYVRERGSWIRDRLEAGETEPLTLAYEPGNGTRYAMLFVPVDGVEAADGVRIPEGCPRPRVNDPERTWVIVGKVNGTPSDFLYPFDLSPGEITHSGYVEGHTGLGIADAAAVTALLRAITGVELGDRKPEPKEDSP